MPSYKTCVSDDLDIMLQHESFPTMFELTLRIQQGHLKIQAQTGLPYTSKLKLHNNSLTLEETMRATFGLQQKLLSKPDLPRAVIRRGEYPLTDAIMDDSLRILHRELDDLQKYTSQPAQSVEENSSITTNKNKKGSKKDAIAIKYSKWQTDILMKWMVDHSEEPFPDQTAVAQLMSQTGLTQSQVVNWTTNVRKRNKKATCQNGKKPHHFIDFLFLVQDRDKQQGKQPSRKKQTTPFSRRTAAMVSPSQSFASPPVYHHDSMMEDEQELFSLNDPEMEDALMNEFATSWLKNNHQQQELQPEPMLVDDSVLGDALDDFMAEHQQPSYPTTLMPSVTDDSTEPEPVVAVANHRKRSRSLDLDLDSEFEEWAESFDLNELDLELMVHFV